MKRQTLLTLTASILLWTIGCSSTPPPAPDTREADIKAIKDADAAEAKDLAAKEFDKLGSYYADDAVFMTTGAPAAVGKDAIQGMSKMLKDGDMELKFESTKVDVAKSGDLGYSQGTYTMAMTDTKTKRRTMEKGNYLTVFRKQADGAWKIIEDINTPDSAPAPLARAKSATKKSVGKKKK